jgi:hypothetical protein
MRKGFLLALVGLAFAAGLVSGVLWQAHYPFLGTKGQQTPGQQSQEVMTLSGNLKSVVQTLGDIDVYYERPFASPPTLTFAREGDVRLFNFKVVEQRADGFKIHVSAISTNEYPRWEAKGQPAGK